MSLSARRAAASSRSSRSRESRGPRSRASSISPSTRVLPRLDPRSFLRGVVGEVESLSGEDYPRLHSTAWSHMAQLWSGNKQLHYEVWIRDRLAVIEVGLHFEADPLTNARLLAAFRAHERSIRRGLGPDVRIEAWDRGWARVWEPVPLAALDRSFLERIGARIAAYITTLEPLLRSEVPSDISWTESRPRR